MAYRYFKDARDLIARSERGFVEVLDKKADEWVKIPGDVLCLHDLSISDEWNEVDESDLND